MSELSSQLITKPLTRRGAPRVFPLDESGRGLALPRSRRTGVEVTPCVVTEEPNGRRPCSRHPQARLGAIAVSQRHACDRNRTGRTTLVVQSRRRALPGATGRASGGGERDAEAAAGAV